MTTDKSNQGRTHEVEQDPDGWGIALEFWGFIAIVGGATALLWSVCS
jgi:hypothetical protein